MMMENKVLDFIDRHQLIQSGESLLIGVSGGADSMALLHLMYRFKETFHCKIGVAHLHHDMRGEIADEDAGYVQRYCDALGVPFYFKKVNVIHLAEIEKISVEEAGREARYAFFDEIMNQENYGILATAHHMDDQAETLLMRLIRGTGLKGAKGIPYQQGKIIRPLLCVTRKEIEGYCRKNHIATRFDSTNDDDELIRNKIRHQIMPQLLSINASASRHFSDFSDKVSEAQNFLDMAVTDAKGSLFDNHPHYFFVDAFSSLHPYLKKEILRSGIAKAGGTLVDVEQRHLQMILKKLEENASVWQLNLNHDVIVRREYDKLYFEKTVRNHSFFDCHTIPMDHSEVYFFENVQVKVEILLTKLTKNEEYCKKDCSIFLSCDKIEQSVCVRSRRAGDTIMLPETEGHKKVKKLLIDRKIPRAKRDNLSVVAMGNEVLLIPCVAKDKRYIKPDATSEKTIKITLELLNESGY